MHPRTYFALAGAIGVAFGLLFTLLPVQTLAAYGMPVEPANVLQARFFGSALVSWGLITWRVRTCAEPAALQAACVGSMSGFSLGALWSAWLLVSPDLPHAPMAWATLLLYLALLAGAIFCFGRTREPRAA